MSESKKIVYVIQELPGTKASERSLIDSSETSSEEENCGTSFKGEGHVMK